MSSAITKTKALGFIAAALLSACTESPPETIAADDYFPLAKGHHWDYRTLTRRGDERLKGEYRVENLGEVERDLEQFSARRNNHGTEYLFRRDATGVYRMAVKTVVSDHIKHDLRKRYVLKLPVASSANWFNDSHAFVIERTQPIRERFWDNHSFEMEYQITARDETVQVPAGKFEHCLRVEASGTVKLLADVTQGRYGSAEGEVRTTEWYAPGVGLIKLLREESFENALFVDGSYLVELDGTSATH